MSTRARPAISATPTDATEPQARGRRARRIALTLLGALGVAVAPARPQTPPPELTVLSVAGERVNVALPAGLLPALGSRLFVERAGELLAELEVTGVGDRSAACRVERLLAPIEVGDAVRFRVSDRPAPPAPAGSLRVSQVTGEAVYLSGGRAAGLAIGQRIDIVRDGTVIAHLEVAFLSTSSASCRVLDATLPVAAGDIAAPGAPPVGAEPAPASERAAARAPRAGRAPRARDPFAGSIALRWQELRDRTDAGASLRQVAAIANVDVRQIGGGAHSLRMRARGGQRQSSTPRRPTATTRDDRLYELTLLYEPQEGRWSYQLGRLGAGPLVGFDYLDGLLGEARLTPRFALGGFYGSRPEVAELSVDQSGRAYGGFLHYLRRSAEETFYTELVLAGIGEYRNGDVDREYLSLYGNQGSGNRWSLYERAELDLNRSWRRTASDASYQLSNLLFSANYGFSRAVRVGVTFDQRRRFRTLDDRQTPEEQFDDALREGLRLTAYLGSGRGLRSNLSVGLRRRENSSEDNLTYAGSVYHADVLGWRLLLGADYSAFAGETSEGYRAGVRGQKYFGAGHDLELTLGTSETTLLTTRERRASRWLRLAGTAQLGRRFFLLGELEVTRGGDSPGERLFLQLGYRL